ncbi:hypothetical protein [Serratia marcescens]|uniref:hypothetical protein n=1 Tax=Serratia marcescens TaxID=615 RepID=UPI0021BB4915|nr:hypothetical protein [Serratia marcescens]
MKKCLLLVLAVSFGVGCDALANETEKAAVPESLQKVLNEIVNDVNVFSLDRIVSEQYDGTGKCSLTVSYRRGENKVYATGVSGEEKCLIKTLVLLNNARFPTFDDTVDSGELTFSFPKKTKK